MIVMLILVVVENLGEDISARAAAGGDDVVRIHEEHRHGDDEFQ